MERPYYKRHHDDEWFDKVQIQVVPRYKTSELSGDEWRVSARVRLFRKGLLLYERSFHRIEHAVKFLPWLMDVEARENGGLPKVNLKDLTEDRCFQPGCPEKAVSEYRMKSEWADGHRIPDDERGFREVRVKFCQRHLRRGDAGLEDADDNYEVVNGPGPDQARGWQEDESPAVFGGAIVVDSPEEL